jgi:hypothetical protein
VILKIQNIIILLPHPKAVAEDSEDTERYLPVSAERWQRILYMQNGLTEWLLLLQAHRPAT